MIQQGESALPSHGDLIDELKLIRRSGITTIARLDLPALRSAAVVSQRVPEASAAGPHVIKLLLGEALDRIGDGKFGNAGEILFGLAPGTVGDPPSVLRERAREYFLVGKSRFRNHYEHLIIVEIAEQILLECLKVSLQEAANAMGDRRPVATRLAVAWLDRFEAYYSLWNSIFDIAISIVAYRHTLFEEDRPYDRPPTPEEPDGYTQEMEARRYGMEALFFFAQYLTRLERFESKFGGLWLLSGKAAESGARDAAYMVHYVTPFSLREQSFLRLKLREAEAEIHSFWLSQEGDSGFSGIVSRWQRFLGDCSCEWDPTQRPERGHFHTHRTEVAIVEECQPHQLISAANDFCAIIDSEWDYIADWYHTTEPRDVGVAVDSSALYEQLRERERRRNSDEWPPWGRATL